MALRDAPNHLAYDVFNGDADGICALHQLRLADPCDAQLITGVKRDIELLQRVPPAADIDVVALDISLDVNVLPLQRLLDAGARVRYFDHHSAQQAFAHPQLQWVWNDAPDVCTSLLVDRHLQGRFRPWAIVAAFGDNLAAPARALASEIGLDEKDTHALDELGRMLNYNAYGDCVDVLHVAPDVLYRAVHQFADPFDFIGSSPLYRLLVDGYRDDAARIEQLAPHMQWAGGAIYLLPSASWARRISGQFANQLAGQHPAHSFAVLTENTDGSFVASVRSGQPTTHAANGLCERFTSGGGRKAAAGINHLPAADVPHFIDTFADYFAMSGHRTLA
ncbi:DHH family phosphoesterase [Andreprevotia chitinilytica]|uniref:DHH family phosphoesterase n=1 Tax=Andreprevotia chitinilytica TaxID=396808 RepID=UPI000550B172|nr:DHH family phosphoesterase [Andreprevotia chitinilytica]